MTHDQINKKRPKHERKGTTIIKINYQKKKNYPKVIFNKQKMYTPDTWYLQMMPPYQYKKPAHQCPRPTHNINKLGTVIRLYCPVPHFTTPAINSKVKSNMKI